MKKNLFILIFYFLTVLLFAEENFYFKRFSTENGLAQNTVYCILQDEQGFMWFGTKDGLCRYDGYQFKTFRNEQTPGSIGNSFIRSLHQDTDGLIWTGTDRGVYIYNPLTESFLPFDKQTEQGISIGKEVNDIQQDKEGNLWFAVDWQGVFQFNIREQQLFFYDLNNIVNAWSIFIDSENKVWTGTHGGGLNYFNRETNRFETITYTQDKYNALGDIYRVYENTYNSILVGTATGVKRFDLVTNQLNDFLTTDKDNVLFVRDILRRSENEIWLGTEAGIYIYNEKTKAIQHLTHDYTDDLSIADNAIYCIYKDREGGIWVGTYFGGVNYYPTQYTPFEKYYPTAGNSLTGKRVREIRQDRNNKIWVGTEDEGLNIFDPVQHRFTHMPSGGLPGNISYYNIHGIMADGDNVWVGTLGHGLDIIDINTRKVIKHYESDTSGNSLCDNSVFCICKDNTGLVWIGTLYGLCTYNSATYTFTTIDYLGNSFISDILQTSDGNIWFATLGNGLHKYNPRTYAWTSYEHIPGDSTSLPYNKITSLFEDSKGNLWIGTEGEGLATYRPATATFKTYTTKDGLPNNIIYKILEDDFQQLWYSTNQGLVCWSPQTKSLKVYTKSNGLLSDQFNYNSGLKDASGRLYFGTLEGFISFDPKNFQENPFAPPVYITNFRLFNELITPSGENSLLSQSTIYGGRIDLRHSQSTFTLDFAALSFNAPEKNNFAYKLQGFDKEWIHTSGNQRAYYSNIPPGRYVFKVKASNNDNLWSDTPAELEIVIHPPFYKTIWAYLIYILLLIAFFIFIGYSIRKRNYIKNKRKQEIFESEKEKELYNAKIAFFTNIAHEIRTPLSLIKGPLEYIMKEKVSEKEQTENLEIIDKNTNRLLDLTNQLLDFRKTEKEGFQLNFIRTDINQVIKDVYERFAPAARRKGLSFDLQIPEKIFFADIDKEAVTKILSNLFNNAFKYAKSQILVTVQEDMREQKIVLKIYNDGHIIPGEYAEKIFEPFFQLKDVQLGVIPSGTGLGLPLSRSLAALHNGSLVLDTSNEVLNTFVLTIPMYHQKSIDLRTEEGNNTNEQELVTTPETLPGEEKKPGKQTILIVEDDAGMQRFVGNILKNKYNVQTANNGQEALDILDKVHIDLVISDILMPVMNGLQLCKQVKSLLNYSHIPIVLLTAKTGIGANIEGLDAGADAYIEKPFSTEYLQAQVANLFTNREKMKLSFANSPFSTAGTMAASKADEEFLQKITDCIHKHLSDENFSVEVLAEELNMSRSSLHRKIKGISELTPNDFILLVRLKKAAELLTNKTYRVTEVCYVVGFSSSSYFSKCFKKYFGLSPRDFIKKEEEKSRKE